MADRFAMNSKLVLFVALSGLLCLTLFCPASGLVARSPHLGSSAGAGAGAGVGVGVRGHGRMRAVSEEPVLATENPGINTEIQDAGSAIVPDSQEDDGGETHRAFCPFVYDQKLSDCEKVKAILDFFHPSRLFSPTPCSRADMLLVEMQTCCSSRDKEDPKICIASLIGADTGDYVAYSLGDAQ